jgi:L-seryl-tRNA(Ser) seleniumtransferase
VAAEVPVEPGSDPRARLPQVDVLLRREDTAAAVERFGRQPVVDRLREELASWRDRLGDPQAAGEPPSDTEVVAAAVERLATRRAGRLRRVVNATGVVLHTNLGRAPLSQAARQAVADAAGYTDLELDLATGRRGSRTAHLGALVAEVAATEDAHVVNNGAAALVLVLAALARDREVVVSRGELVEIGGSYRLPDVMVAAGARLVEVGTTNRTRIGDHRDGVGEDTALLLKVHRSNFAIVGFTEEASIEELVALGAQTGLPVVHDLGSGLLRDVTDGPLAHEPSVAASVRAGADLVVVSGDKLLGGPQAGIVAGRRELVATCRRHPLARAMRVDKLQRAALEATLESHLREAVPRDVPTVAMLHADPDELRERAGRIAAELGSDAEVVALTGAVGGGAAPDGVLPSWGVAVPGDPDVVAARLRAGDPPVLARVEDGRVVLDVRTVPPSADVALIDLTRAAVDGP